MKHWLFEEEHEILRKTVRRFVQKEIGPQVAAWEEAARFPRELFRRLGELGFLGLACPGEEGGGLDHPAQAVFLEELARCGSGGVWASVCAHLVSAMPLVGRLGTGEQKERFLTPAVRGESVAALAAVRQEASRGDACAVVAVREGDHYVVNGTQTGVLNAGLASYVVLAARTGPADGDLTLLVLEKGLPGLEVNGRRAGVGWHAADLADLALTGCRVPVAGRLGEENRGGTYLDEGLAWERLVVALGAVGAADLALTEALQYAGQRVQFGRPLAKFQVIRHKLVDMATAVERARALTYHALTRIARGEDAGTEAAMARLVACQTGVAVADEALQIHGGYGYITEFPVERYWRDARVAVSAGGSSGTMREIIAGRLWEGSYGLQGPGEEVGGRP